MDPRTFDAMAKSFSRSLSRRSVVGGSVAAWLLTTAALVDDALAKKRKTRNNRNTGNRDDTNRNRGARKNDKQKGNGGGGNDKNDNDKKDKDKKDGGGRARKEACIPTGKKCPSAKARGKGKDKKKSLGCDRCCQGTFNTTSDGTKKCACKIDGTGCNSPSQCCSGRCDGGLCVCEGCATGGGGSAGGGCGAGLKDCQGQCIPRSECCGGCADGDVCCDGECRTGSCCDTPCEASDQCHDAGVCDLETGVCSNPAKPNGTGCDDGTPCTVDDACQNGECAGTAKDCSGEDDACNTGACRAADGACIKQPKDSGIACSDNNSCTDGDSCQNGTCTPGTGTNCGALDDECNTGVCRQSDGECVKQPKDDSTSCNADSNACTEGDRCQGGTCIAGAPRSCPVCQACSGGDCQPVGSDARCATVCCDGTCCDAGEQCIGTSCQGICIALNAPCDSNDNQCCQSPPTSCAPLAPNCYATGAPRNDQCCRDLRGACATDCECCGLSGCEGNQCCNQPGGSCGAKADCCGSDDNKRCLAGTCCVLDACEPEDDRCCSGFCGPEGFCQGCLALQQICEPDNNQCCQGEPTSCAPACDFDNPTCCHARGGTCTTNCDCCGGEACTNGRCCVGEYAVCEASSECCPGFECRGAQFEAFKRCRTAICLEPGEFCDPARPCCPAEGVQCSSPGSSGSCCQPLGSTCEQVPGAFSPCCDGIFQECGGARQTCCLVDFNHQAVPPFGIIGDPCQDADDCCSGFCHVPTGNCCRTEGAQCNGIGPLNGDCCTFLGLTCSGENGFCIPCRRLGETCVEGPTGISTCCLGSGCHNGVCVQSQCIEAGPACQEDSVCCPGSVCNRDAGSCIQVCQVEGELCAPGVPVLECCGGLNCTGPALDGRCTRP